MNQEQQQKYMEFQMLQQQAEQMHQYLKELETKLSEYVRTRMGLNELGDVKAGSEIFAPIAPGIFVKAEIKGTEDLLVNVGAGVSALKGRDNAIELISRQIAAVEEAQTELGKKLEETSQRVAKIAEELS